MRLGKMAAGMAATDCAAAMAPVLTGAFAAAPAPPGLSKIDPPLRVWSRALAPGETLDALLAEAGLLAADRAEVALVLGEYLDARPPAEPTERL